MTTLTLPSDSIDDLLEEIPPEVLSDDAEQWTRDICDALFEHHSASGRAPDGLAAASIYAAALAKNDYHNGTRLSQKQVAEWCDVSVMTIRNNYKRVVAAWAEVNEDDLDDRDRRIYANQWGADIDVPERETVGWGVK